jgi:sensor histidine kinase YesM
MRNAIERIKMYYGDSSSVFVESPTGGGTRIHIQLPAVREGVVPS